MSERPKRITILHGLPDSNSGGAALGIALVDVLQQHYPDAELTYVSSHSREDVLETAYPFIREACPKLDIVPYPVLARADNFSIKRPLLRRAKNLVWLAATLRALLTLLFPLLAGTNRTFKRIRESALVVSRGTQIFYDQPGHPLQSIVSKFWLCIPLLYAWRVGVPYIVYAQSIGPIHYRSVRCLMRFVLRRAELVLPRERYSQQYLIEELEISPNKVRLVPDSVFALDRPPATEIDRICADRGLPTGKYLCLVVRRYVKERSEQSVSDLFESIETLCQYTLAGQICEQIVIVTQCHDLPHYGGFECDSAVSNELFDKLRSRFGDSIKLIDEAMSPHDLMCLYGGARYVFTVRLHAAIFAMISGTPSVAVSYWGSKTRGIYQMISLRDAYIEKENLQRDALVDKLKQIESDHDAFCERMNQEVAQVHDAARETPAVFRYLLETAKSGCLAKTSAALTGTE